MYAARSAEQADESKQGNLSFSQLNLYTLEGCFVFGNDAQHNADKGKEHPDERPLTLLDTKNVLTKLLTSQTVSLYLTRAIGPLSSNKRVKTIFLHFLQVYLKSTRHHNFNTPCAVYFTNIDKFFNCVKVNLGCVYNATLRSNKQWLNLESICFGYCTWGRVFSIPLRKIRSKHSRELKLSGLLRLSTIRKR